MDVFTKMRHLTKSTHFLSRWVGSQSWDYCTSVRSAFNYRKLRFGLVCELEKDTVVSSRWCHIYGEMR